MADVTLAGLPCPLTQLSYSVQARAALTGGMGFRYETGVITVAAMADRVRVTADRFIEYDGTHSHNPAGSEFDIGSPSVTADGLSLDIPVSVTPLQSVTVVVEPLAVTIEDGALSVTVQDQQHLTVIVED